MKAWVARLAPLDMPSADGRLIDADIQILDGAALLTSGNGSEIGYMRHAEIYDGHLYAFGIVRDRDIAAAMRTGLLVPEFALTHTLTRDDTCRFIGAGRVAYVMAVTTCTPLWGPTRFEVTS